MKALYLLLSGFLAFFAAMTWTVPVMKLCLHLFYQPCLIFALIPPVLFSLGLARCIALLDEFDLMPRKVFHLLQFVVIVSRNVFKR